MVKTQVTKIPIRPALYDQKGNGYFLSERGIVQSYIAYLWMMGRWLRTSTYM